MQIRDPDALIGKTLALAGSGGLTVQWWTDFGNLFVIVGNGLLVIGGLYLLYLRIRSARIKLRRRLYPDNDAAER